MNIKKIAEKAKVSVATVSRVLNNSEKVTEKTKTKVRNIMKELDYYPNVNATRLRKNENKIILICVPDITNIIYSQIVKGVLEYLKLNDYYGMIHITHEDLKKEVDLNEYIYLFETKKIDGIIFITSSIEEKDYIYLNKKYNIISCSEYFENTDLETVGVNQVEAMYKLVKYLFEQKNIKKVMYYTWQFPTGTSRERLKGYFKYLDERRIENKENYYKESDFKNLDKFLIDLEKELKEDENIDAIILNSDFYALFCEKIVKKIDREIYVASFDGTRLMDISSDKMIYIRQPFEKMGKNSAKILINKMNKKEYDKKIFLNYELVDNQKRGK